MEKLINILSHSLAMGGYAAYVWPAYFITALAMLGMLFVTLRSLKKTQKTLAQLQKSAISPAPYEP